MPTLPEGSALHAHPHRPLRHGARTVASFPLAGVASAQQPTDRDCRDFASQAAAHAFPTERVYGDIDHAGLRLITCGGEFDRAVRSYRDNVVVYASLVGSAVDSSAA